MFTMFMFALGAHHAIEKAYVTREQRERQNTHVKWRHFIVFPFRRLNVTTQFISARLRAGNFCKRNGTLRSNENMHSNDREKTNSDSCNWKMLKSPFIAHTFNHSKNRQTNPVSELIPDSNSNISIWIECYYVHSSHNIYVQHIPHSMHSYSPVVHCSLQSDSSN